MIRIGFSDHEPLPGATASRWRRYILKRTRNDDGACSRTQQVRDELVRVAGAGGRGAGDGWPATWTAWWSVANPGCSIKPCQVFIGADTDYELTFGLDHSMGAGQ